MCCCKNLCPGFCPGTSLANAASAIAILDLVLVSFPLTFETATVGYYLGILGPLGSESTKLEPCSIRENCTWLDEQIDKITFKSNTSIVTTLILLTLLGAVIEGYLFTLLRSGVREAIYKHCKQWMGIRIFLLIFTCLGSLGKVYRHHYSLEVDGLFDIIKIYRLIALLIVLCYMKELERTVGTIYIEPISKPKRGSLGQDIHLLD